MDAEKLFNKIVEESKSDQNIVGLYLTGSRATGIITKHSDWDFGMIVKNGKKKQYWEKYKYLDKHKSMDFWIFDIKELKEKRVEEWDRYAFANVKVVVDKKNGKIKELLKEKSKIPKKEITKYISGHLDGYINQVYRSLKCFRDGNTTCGHLEAVYSVKLIMKTIFAIHNRKPAPYPKYYNIEFTKENTLKKLPFSPGEFYSMTKKILENGDINSQQKILKTWEKIFRKEGYGKVFDSWPKLEWMKTFKP